MSTSAPARAARRFGFTLVELLVVIGIIAILIGILLPALSSARRSAQQVKCGAALQQIGLGFQLYSNDQKFYFPVAKLVPGKMTPPPAGNAYSIGDQIFIAATGASTETPAYWFNFIAGYVAATGVGASANPGSDVGLAKRSIIWGCPSFEGYISSTTNTTAALQTGYGMNGYPTFTDSSALDPSTHLPPVAEWAYIANSVPGRFFKQGEWTDPANRALVGDSRFWLMESQEAPAGPSWTLAVSKDGQDAEGNNTYSSGTSQDQTMVDIYRHGRTPSKNGAVFEPGGGKVGYNLLFCDFHVGQFGEAKTAYSAIRMRFPG